MLTADFVEIVERNLIDDSWCSLHPGVRGPAAAVMPDHYTLSFGNPQDGDHRSVPWPVIPEHTTYWGYLPNGQPDPGAPIKFSGWRRLLRIMVGGGHVELTQEIVDVLGIDYCFEHFAKDLL